MTAQARDLGATDPTKLMKDIHVNSVNYLAHIVRKRLRPAGALAPAIRGASLLHALRASYLFIYHELYFMPHRSFAAVVYCPDTPFPFSVCVCVSCPGVGEGLFGLRLSAPLSSPDDMRLNPHCRPAVLG
eukprot:jgi/Chrzof1/13193/Cz07g23170.t1